MYPGLAFLLLASIDVLLQSLVARPVLHDIPAIEVDAKITKIW